MTERRRSWIVGVVGVVLLLCIGGSWALASPLGSTPDEDFHLGSIWCSHTARNGGCIRTGVQDDPGTEHVIIPLDLAHRSFACFVFAPDVSAACQDQTPDASIPTLSRANDGLYPGGYYQLMGLLVSGRITVSVLAMRMLSWVMCIGLLGAAAALAARPVRRALLIGVLATAVPMAIYLFASVNPSGLCIAAIAALWCAAYTFMSPDVTGRRLVGAGVVAGLAAACGILSRTDAGLFAAVTVGTVWLLRRGWRDLRNRRTILLAAIAAVGLVGLAFGSGAGEAASGLASHPDRVFGEVLFQDVIHLPEILLGGLGLARLGWVDTVLPQIVWIPMIMVATSVVTIGLRGADSLRSRCVGLLVLALAAIPLYVLLAGSNLVGENVQARYLVPLLAVIAGTALLPDADGRWQGFGRTHLIVLASAISVANAAALHTNMRRYITGTDGDWFNLDRWREWWWPHAATPMTVWAIGSVSFAVVCTWVLLTLGAGPPQPPDLVAP